MDDNHEDDNQDHDRLWPPRRRLPTDPAVRYWRTPTVSIRRASGMPLWARIERQTERDALLHRLDALDTRLLALSTERRAIVEELGEIRDELYPAVPWCHGRRPPDLDCSPLPPAAPGADAVEGRRLRAACLSILRRHGATALRELHGLLHRYGYVVRAVRPVTCLSDAMAYEVEQGRARRLARGVYEAIGAEPPRRRDRPSPFPDLPDLPEPWASTGPSALDPALDEDPSSWRTSGGEAGPGAAWSGGDTRGGRRTARSPRGCAGRSRRRGAAGQRVPTHGRPGPAALTRRGRRASRHPATEGTKRHGDSASEQAPH